ncbi:prolyl oligopeptidase-like protein [Calycina marina]|uniref:Prolyl oligopeptidase-like protein n=1 Tax=Calycina marina TaxID=1763456 RepID=A0A9P7ZAI4_9HELO|nr:prolyl oligopeptidase-like protein [Calycina marina]
MSPRLAMPALLRNWQPISCRTYSSGRVTLAFDLHQPAKGSSPEHAPIIFMHGLFGSKKNNRSMSKALARDLGRDVYAVDLRNHGDSPHNSRHDYMAMADDVAGFIKEHKLSKDLTLIGHSMGAKTAMTLALQLPDLMKDIISVDNAPWDVALLSDFGKYVRAMKNIEQAGVTKQTEADAILQEVEESTPVRLFLLTNLMRPKGETKQKFRVPLDTIGASLGHLGDFPFKDPEAVRFEKRALFVRGTQSLYIPDEALPVIGKFFPRFELADIDAGHWLIAEKPEEFRRVVVDFLQPAE